MTVVDSSVIIAGFASWHEAHSVARTALMARPGTVTHCLIETYSVLTRLPAPHRAPADVVSEFLKMIFPADPLALEAADVRLLVTQTLPDGQISGGACYDALIGYTAARHGEALLTLDRRAWTTYERVGCTSSVLNA